MDSLKPDVFYIACLYAGSWGLLSSVPVFILSYKCRISLQNPPPRDEQSSALRVTHLLLHSTGTGALGDGGVAFGGIEGH